MEMTQEEFSQLKPPVALVVDDEALILMDTADMISDEGYAVIQATTAEAAFAFLVEHPDLQLLFTDVQTGGAIDGLQLAREVAKRWPQICVVIVSGAVRPLPSELPDGVVFLAKPLSVARVHETIKQHCGKPLTPRQ